MSATLEQVQQLVSAGEVRISDHGYEELAADDLSVREILAGISQATVIEDYPQFARSSPRDPRCWCYHLMVKGGRFMWCGAFPKAMHLQPFL